MAETLTGLFWERVGTCPDIDAQLVKRDARWQRLTWRDVETGQLDWRTTDGGDLFGVLDGHSTTGGVVEDVGDLLGGVSGVDAVDGNRAGDIRRGRAGRRRRLRPCVFRGYLHARPGPCCPFQIGTFKAAVEAGRPVVPIALGGHASRPSGRYSAAAPRSTWTFSRQSHPTNRRGTPWSACDATCVSRSPPCPVRRRRTSPAVSHPGFLNDRVVRKLSRPAGRGTRRGPHERRSS